MSEKKKSTCAACAQQFGRLADKPFFGQLGREAALGSIETLHDYGHDRAPSIIDECAVRMFGDNGADRVPSRAQLWAICKMDPREFITVPAPAVAKPPKMVSPANCPRCSGSGWESITRIVNDVEYTATQRCECAAAAGQCVVCRSAGFTTWNIGTELVKVEFCDCVHGRQLTALKGIDWQVTETNRLQVEAKDINDKWAANCLRIPGRKPAVPRPVVAGNITMSDVKRAVQQVRQ
jgi:hypothetical protein